MDDYDNTNGNFTKEKNKNVYSRYVRYVILRIKKHINLTIDSDDNATISRIEEGIEFKGANVWILAFAIIIASVGLNVNATAVIIGAMLISPLMGPIMGIGLAIGINDNKMLNRSLRNFGIMVIISLLSSTFYFLISPLSDAQSELLARTQPTIYDILIAFFGGLAGIVAHSRKGEKITIVSGVAIATALMPPLCTAGYGLATGQLNFFFGAFYLFFINTFFIALATVIISYYLKLPKRSFIDQKKSKQVKRSVYLFTALVGIPSIFMTINMLQESSFNSNAIRFVNDLQSNPPIEQLQIISSERKYTGKESTITLVLVGKNLDEMQTDALKERLSEFGLKNTNLVIRQPMGSDIHFIEDMYKKNMELSDKIIEYKNDLVQLQNEMISSEQIAKEIKTQFNTIHSFSIFKAIYTDIKTLKSDTVPTARIIWLEEKIPEEDVQRLSNWLKVRLKLNKLELINSTQGD